VSKHCRKNITFHGLAYPKLTGGLPTLYLSLRFNGHFPGEPGLASFIEAKDDGSGGDNWSHKTCKAAIKSPPANQHPTFYRPDALPVTQ